MVSGVSDRADRSEESFSGKCRGNAEDTDRVRCVPGGGDRAPGGGLPSAEL